MASIPASAKAARLYETGGLDNVKIEDTPIAELQEDEILVKNAYSGVNFIENYFISGLYPRDLPTTLGGEGAGEVVKVGSKVKNFSVGDKVLYLQQGAMAEYTAVDTKKFVNKLPEGVDERSAAASTLQAFTAHSLVHEVAQVKKGQFVLVHAAAGGTGALVVQVAKLAGATVIGSTSTPEKVEIAKKAGADYVINYKSEDLVARVKEITDGHGADAVLDGVGASTWQQSLDAIARKGTLVSFGNASGAVPPIKLNVLTSKNIKLARPTLFGSITNREEWEYYVKEVYGLIGAGKLKVTVGKEYSLQEFPQALKDIASGKTTGKLIIKL